MRIIMFFLLPQRAQVGKRQRVHGVVLMHVRQFRMRLNNRQTT